MEPACPGSREEEEAEGLAWHARGACMMHSIWSLLIVVRGWINNDHMLCIMHGCAA